MSNIIHFLQGEITYTKIHKKQCSVLAEIKFLDYSEVRVIILVINWSYTVR